MYRASSIHYSCSLCPLCSFVANLTQQEHPKLLPMNPVNPVKIQQDFAASTSGDCRRHRIASQLLLDNCPSLFYNQYRDRRRPRLPTWNHIMTCNSHKGMVYLVGAGPGDAGLLTRAGAEALARAEVVIYDRR